MSMLSVFIGRFQPVHNQHLSLALRALESSDRLLILIGSCWHPPTAKNPFSGEDRMRQWRSAIPTGLQDRVIIALLHDHPYSDDDWVDQVKARVNEVKAEVEAVRLVGHTKDDSSYYLTLFPEWEYAEITSEANINSADIRQLMFGGKPINFIRGVVPCGVYDQLSAYVQTQSFKDIQEECDAIAKDKKTYGTGPFVTVDCLVIAEDSVFCVRRKKAPGRGLLAMPGGYLEPTEWIFDGALRELEEETHLDVSKTQLKEALIGSAVLDYPGRSLRGRLISHLYVFALDHKPAAQADDDAESVEWVKFADLRSSNMFDDHYHAITSMLKELGYVN